MYGFPFDTRPCLRTEFLIVSHYCANLNSLPLLSSLVSLLSSLFSRLSISFVSVHEQLALTAYTLFQRKLLNISFFDNCFKHSVYFFSFILFVLLLFGSKMRFFSVCVLLTFVGQSHMNREAFIQIR